MLDVSAAYATFLDPASERLDYLFQHPAMDPIKVFRGSRNTFRFGDQLRVRSDGKPAADYGVTASGKLDGNVKYINIQNLSEHGILLGETAYLDKEEDNVSDYLRLMEGDILISRSRLVGRAGLVTEEWEGETYGSYIIRFRLSDDTQFSPEFVVRFVNSKMGQDQITLLMSGSSGYNINSNQLMDIRLPNVAPDVQEAIISAIRPIETEAWQREEQANLYRKEVQNSLLTELGISISSGDADNYFFKTGYEGQTLWFSLFPEDLTDRLHYLAYHPRYNILDQLKAQYQTTQLGNIGQKAITRGEQPDYDEAGTIPVFKTVDLKNSYLDTVGALRVSKDFYDSHSGAHVNYKDILVASTGYVSMGKVDVYDSDEQAMVDGHISIVSLAEGYEPAFLTYYLRSHLGQLQFERYFTGSSGQIELQPGDLGKFMLPTKDNGGVPPAEQTRIAGVISERLRSARDLELQAVAKWREVQEQFDDMVDKAFVVA